MLGYFYFKDIGRGEDFIFIGELQQKLIWFGGYLQNFVVQDVLFFSFFLMYFLIIFFNFDISLLLIYGIFNFWVEGIFSCGVRDIFMRQRFDLGCGIEGCVGEFEVGVSNRGYSGQEVVVRLKICDLRKRCKCDNV